MCRDARDCWLCDPSRAPEARGLTCGLLLVAAIAEAALVFGVWWLF